MQTEEKTPQPFQSIEWCDSFVRILDQTFLPSRTVYSDIRDVGRIWEAIRKLRVRGAPAIGIAAAYGMYLGIRDLPESNYASFEIEVRRIASYLAESRPTAVNLFWALERVKTTIHAHRDEPISSIKSRVLKLAQTIHEEDKRVCKNIGLIGQELVPANSQILTHCNTGGLATGQYGTALSVIYHAHEQGKGIHVWVDETRPLLQGSRLTAWELMRAGIPMHLVTDSMAGHLMQIGKVDLVIVGTDRVAANGDMANKIGTYSLAVLAKHHNIPFYVATPASTVDLSISDGSSIPIEERDGKEVTTVGNSEIAPARVDVYNPAFDVTPAGLITAYITEKGIIRPEYATNLEAAFG
jgi:methylthioribose-1-phosphate isomerase